MAYIQQGRKNLFDPDERLLGPHSRWTPDLDFLSMYMDFRLESEGGYPAAWDASTFPHHIVVADVEQDEPVLRIYLRSKVRRLYQEAFGDILKAWNDGKGVQPNDEDLDDAMTHFFENISDCEV